MRFQDQSTIVTGGASGIGAALARALAAEGAKVAVADLNADGAKKVADEIGGIAVPTDVRSRDAIAALIAAAEAAHGPIDLMCSNAGIATGVDTTFTNAAGADPAEWQRAWEVNVMAHVHAAANLVPQMIARGGGRFLHTVSAAGLLNQIGSAIYGTTKHAAVGFAENLAISHYSAGIRVSILCPQGVDTPMLDGMGGDGRNGPQAGDGLISAADCAAAALDGVAEGRFVILPHPQVADYMQRKTADYDRWIAGMAKFQNRLYSV
ncbi:short-chain dehydrogenase [Oceanicola sp. 22II-s10i]|uniref:SDR family oxidoreductase n=1 Tax=Oceanicola sp. 22II-s10i TaxID=1317116 RepID=UPI000B525797|nr:SDR family NAD(P)-dependent oxidoreductase [Oceanicola sp. 22II-s10i]OWU85827.1 short-chain dehydrogenase [Oceanicola sp. 22II-s10i]